MSDFILTVLLCLTSWMLGIVYVFESDMPYEFWIDNPKRAEAACASLGSTPAEMDFTNTVICANGSTIDYDKFWENTNETE